MNTKIIQGVADLQQDVKEASERIDNNFDNLINLCDSVIEILARIEEKLDQI
jgi:uncharacterized protein YoxC